VPPITLEKLPHSAEVLCFTGENYDEVESFTTIDGETYCGKNTNLDGEVVWVAHKPSVDDTNFRQIPVPVGDFITLDQREGSFGFIVLKASFVYDEYGYLHTDPEVVEEEAVAPDLELDADGNPIIPEAV
jgi:hypothetical protein